MPGQVMPDIDALDNALYVSQNGGIVVTGPSYPYASLLITKKFSADIHIEAYQDNSYSPLDYLSFSIEKGIKPYTVDAPPLEHNPFEYVDFEIDLKSSMVAKDTILGEYVFALEEQEFEEIFVNTREDIEYPYIYFDDMYYFFINGSSPDVENTDQEDTCIIQEFIKLKPEVYSPPRELTDLIGLMESIDMNVLSYDYMSSPLLYTGITPFVQVGTRVNKVIYPRTTMRVRGKARRGLCR